MRETPLLLMRPGYGTPEWAGNPITVVHSALESTAMDIPTLLSSTELNSLTGNTRRFVQESGIMLPKVLLPLSGRPRRRTQERLKTPLTELFLGPRLNQLKAVRSRVFEETFRERVDLAGQCSRPRVRTPKMMTCRESRIGTLRRNV